MGICIAHQECCREGISCTHSIDCLARDDRLLIELAAVQRYAAAQPLGDDRDIGTQLLGPSGKGDALAIRQALSREESDIDAGTDRFQQLLSMSDGKIV